MSWTVDVAPHDQTITVEKKQHEDASAKKKTQTHLPDAEHRRITCADRLAEIVALIRSGAKFPVASTVEAFAHEKAGKCRSVYNAYLTEAEDVIVKAKKNADQSLLENAVLIAGAMTKPRLGSRSGGLDGSVKAGDDDEVCCRCGGPALSFERTLRGDEPTVARFACMNPKCRPIS